MKRKVERDLKAQVDAQQREKEHAIIAAARKEKVRIELQRKQIIAAQKAAHDAKMKQLQEDFLLSVRSKCNHEPIVARVQGGSGLQVAENEIVLVTCQAKGIALSKIEIQQEFILPYSELVAAEVTGPGTESSNVRLIGGGFGLEGALKGILIASVINALTSKRTTNTFLRLSTRKSEVHLHTSTLEPGQLRLILSPAFVQMEANRQIPQAQLRVNDEMLSTEIKQLYQMHREGVISAEEFSLAKKKLLAITIAD